MLCEHRFQHLFSLISRPTLKVQLKSTADVVCFAWRTGVLGEVCLLGGKATQAQECSLPIQPPLLHSGAASSSSALGWWMIAGGGEKDMTHPFQISLALAVRTEDSEDQSKSIFQVFNGPCPLNMKAPVEAPQGMGSLKRWSS